MRISFYGWGAETKSWLLTLCICKLPSSGQVLQDSTGRKGEGNQKANSAGTLWGVRLRRDGKSDSQGGEN